jgi:hypothetical protein
VRKLLIGLAIYAFGSCSATAGAYEDIITAANNGETPVVIDLLKRGWTSIQPIQWAARC